MPSKQFPPDLKVRLTADWLCHHTLIFRPTGKEEGFDPDTAQVIRERFKAYWQTWIAPELEGLIGKPIPSTQVSKEKKK